MTYEGPWLKLPLPRPQGPGSMHDDDVAQAQGYQGGFMGNVDIAGLATQAMMASFGHTWYENGAFKINLIKPVFADQEVHIVWEDRPPDPGDKRKIAFRVEKRNGDVASAGWAAAGEPGGPRVQPTWERDPAPPLAPEDDLMPEAQLGRTGEPFECSITRERFLYRLDGVQDFNWWFRIASPWGEPVVPPPLISAMVLDAERRLVRARGSGRRGGGAAVAGGRELLMFGPVFGDRVYHTRSELVVKGKGQSSFFTVTEYPVLDAEERTVAVVRSKVSYLKKSGGQ